MQIHRRRRPPKAIIMYIACALLLGACGGQAGSGNMSPSPSNSQGAIPSGSSGPPVQLSRQTYSPRPLDPAVKVNVGDGAANTSAAVYLAMDRGYYDQEGLRIETVAINGPTDVLPSLTSGQLDFAVGSASAALFNAVPRGLGIKQVTPVIVANKGYKAAALVVRKDLVDGGKYHSLGDLRSMKVGVLGRASTSEYLVQLALAQGGMTSNDVDWTVLPQPDMITALSNKNIDAAWMIEPFISLAQGKGIGAPVAVAGDLSPGFLQAGYLASPKILGAADVVQRFVTATLRGERDYYDVEVGRSARETLVQTLIKHTNAKDPAQYQSINLGGATPNGEFDLASLDQLQNFFIQAGVQTQKVDITQLVDQSFVNKAVMTLGRV